jgi:H+-translocating diphosphatase
MKMEMLSEILTQILMHVAALIGVVFALLQWILVSRVSVFVANHTDVNNGY